MSENPIRTYAKNLQSSGKGKATRLDTFPGVEVFFTEYCYRTLSFQHKDFPGMIQINYCLDGRMGWKMNDGVCIYLGAGDLSLHAMDCCSHSSITLPTDHYRGVTVSVDLAAFEKNPPALLSEAGIRAKALARKLCPEKKPFCLPANPEIDGIFSVLCRFEKSVSVPYCKLKIQELFFYLDRLDPAKEKTLNEYYSSQVELIKEIHDFLIQNLDKRFTIEALARRYPINASSLKSVFKAVYGQPIASYMKERRIRRAMELLRTTDDSVAAIAKSLSYENQGKFTKAFKDFTQTMPTEYRRQRQT